ncbi:MAG: hypothetical protein P8166_17640, partial [Candidatus Thiodiazotropha sp.]
MHTASIFTRYDLTLEKEQRPGASEVAGDLLLQRVANCLLTGDEEEVRRAATEVLNSPDALQFIKRGCTAVLRGSPW